MVSKKFFFILIISMFLVTIVYADRQLPKLDDPITSTTTVISGTAGDGNASSICNGDQVLLGNGTCSNSTAFFDDTTIPDTNESTRFGNLVLTDCPAGQFAIGTYVNGTIQCSDFTDTNESTRFGNLVLTDCPAGQLAIGVQANGTLLCVNDANDLDGNASSICSSGEVLLGNGTCWDTINFFDDTTIPDTNESERFGNLVLTDCPAGQQVMGVLSNGTVLCDNDEGNDSWTEAVANGKYIKLNGTTFNLTIHDNLTVKSLIPFDSQNITFDSRANSSLDSVFRFLNHFSSGLGKEIKAILRFGSFNNYTNIYHDGEDMIFETGYGSFANYIFRNGTGMFLNNISGGYNLNDSLRLHSNNHGTSHNGSIYMGDDFQYDEKNSTFGFFTPAQDQEALFSIGGRANQVNRYIFGVSKSFNDTSGLQSGAIMSLNANPQSASTASTYGLFLEAGTNTGNKQNITNNEALIGVKMKVNHRGTGNITQAVSLLINAIGNNGIIGKMYGIFIDRQEKPGVTQGFGVYQSYVGDENYFAGRVGIGTEAQNGYLEVNGDVSDISIYASKNISATGFITRTSIFDKRKKAFDYVRDSDDYKKADGEINHSRFYGYTTWKTNVTDKSRPESVTSYITNCDQDPCIVEEVQETIYPHKKEVVNEGVDLGEQTVLLEQAIYELKQENELLKSELCNKGGQPYVFC